MNDRSEHTDFEVKGNLALLRRIVALQEPAIVQGLEVEPAMAEHILRVCPAAEASWYDGVGHAPHLEEPERFNRELAALARSTRVPVR